MIPISQTVDLGYERGRATPALAASLWRLDARLGRAVDVNSAWRDPVDQAKRRKAYLDYLAGNGPWAPYALTPEDSWHCKGLAIDTDDRGGILDEYGFLQTNSSEPWHRDYIVTRDRHRNEGIPAGGGGSNIVPINQGEIDMAIILVATTTNGWLKAGMAFADGFTEPITVLTTAELGALDYWAKRGVPYRRAEWTAIDILKLIDQRGIRPQQGSNNRTAYDVVNY